MKQISWRRVSILGIVLTTVSVVTAAILPNKEKIRFDHQGSFTAVGTNDNGAVITCTTSVGTPVLACNVTNGTLTTSGTSGNSYTTGGFQTAENTTS